MTPQDHELFVQVKDRFLAACKEIMLHRLKDIQDRYPEVDTDLLLELVILTGIGFLNRMDRQDGRGDVLELFDHLLRELTALACEKDENLMEDIGKAAKIVEQHEQAKEEDKPTTPPLPGTGLFGFHFPKGGN
jgi:hypothetical protein